MTAASSRAGRARPASGRHAPARRRRARRAASSEPDAGHHDLVHVAEPRAARARGATPAAARRATRGRTRRGRPCRHEAAALRWRCFRCRGDWPAGRSRATREQAPQLGQAERLVQVGAVEALEEREGVAPHGVAGAEDQPGGQLRVPPGQLLVELAAAELGHPEVGDDEVEVARVPASASASAPSLATTGMWPHASSVARM